MESIPRRQAAPFSFSLQQFAEGDDPTKNDPPKSDPPKSDPPKNDPPVDPKDDDAKASAVIKRLNEEAKANRERAEKAEAESAAAKKKLDEIETAKLEEQKQFKELADKRKAELEAAEARHAASLAERDAALVREAVARAAVKAGIVDEDDIDLPAFAEALKLAKVDGGRVSGAADAVAKMKELKPSKFADEAPPDPKPRDKDGRFVPPRPADRTKPVDASTLSDDEFEKLTERLRRGG